MGKREAAKAETPVEAIEAIADLYEMAYDIGADNLTGEDCGRHEAYVNERLAIINKQLGFNILERGE